MHRINPSAPSTKGEDTARPAVRSWSRAEGEGRGRGREGAEGGVVIGEVGWGAEGGREAALNRIFFFFFFFNPPYRSCSARSGRRPRVAQGGAHTLRRGADIQRCLGEGGGCAFSDRLKNNMEAAALSLLQTERIILSVVSYLGKVEPRSP